MAVTIGGIGIDPQGQTLVVDITPRAKVYTSQAGTTLATFPATITTRTSYFVSAAQRFTVSTKLNSVEIAGPTGGTLDVDIQQGVFQWVSPRVDSPTEDAALGGGSATLAVKDEGVTAVATASAIDFVGAGVTATDGGSGTATVTIPGAATPSIAVKDEGIATVAAATTINFVGAGVTATDAGGGTATVTVPGSAAAAGTVNGWVNGVDDNGMVGDAKTASDGNVAIGALSTLTAASAPFVSGDVGKTVVLVRKLTISDATMSAGSAVLTSAGNQVPTWVQPGMVIHVAEAGTAGKSLVTTVLTNDGVGQLTLNATAVGSVTTKFAAVYPVHRTTISAFGSSSSVSLTAAAPYAFISATTTIAWGTDNRAAYAAAQLAAVTAKKGVYVPPGNYLIALDAGNPNAMASAANAHVMLRGAGRDLTNLWMAYNAVPTANGALCLAGSGSSIEASDFSVAVYAPQHSDANTVFGAVAIVNRAGTTEQWLRLARINTDPTWRGNTVWDMAAGTGTANARGILEDVWGYSTGVCGYFFVNDGTDAKLWVTRGRSDTNYQLTTNANDNQYNPHANYIHPSVARSYVDHTWSIQSTGPSGVWAIHDNGTPTDVPAFIRYVGCRTEGVAGGILVQPQTENAEFISCNFQAGGISSAATLTVLDCLFGTKSGIGITASGKTAVIRACRFTNSTTANFSPISLSSATGSNTVIIESCIVPFLSNWAQFVTLNTVSSQTVDLVNCRVTGLTGSANGVIGPLKLAHKVRVMSGVYTGTSASGLFWADTSASTGYCRLQDVDLTGVTGTAIYDQQTTGTDGPFRVYNCLFGAATAPTRSDGRTGNLFAARLFTSPTAVTSANPLVLDHDFARYTCNPGAAINIDNVYRSTAARTKMCSEEVIIRNTAAAGSGFNLVFKNVTGNLRGSNAGTAGDVTITPGEMALLIGDGTGNWDVRNLG